MLTFNGKPFDPKDFKKKVEEAITKTAEEHLRKQIGSIRHPDTGEFPTMYASGEYLDQFSMAVEGSSELLDIISNRFNDSKIQRGAMNTGSASRAPKVFLSYASEDRDLASEIAYKLQNNGIDTWWAEWCISAGDSLRQKIDQGLGECTHFVVLLTPISIKKPWVNQEMDAGLIQKLDGAVTFIPLRHTLPSQDLPLLLRGMLSPEITNVEKDIAQLVNDIYGVTRKPPLGQAPLQATSTASKKSGYSVAASAIAKVFVDTTVEALFGDPQYSFEQLCEKTLLSEDDVKDGLFELGSMLLVSSQQVFAEPELFSTFDSYWQDWNPLEDALRLAADMLNDENFPTELAEISMLYGWTARRLNPAVAYLDKRKLISARRSLGTNPWYASCIQKTDDTRRFVKSRT